MAKGSCLCGTVTYEVDGPFNTMMSCHCSMCRKHHGSPFATYVSAPKKSFRWLSGEDRILAYQSSKNGSRTSCAVCGSAVPLVTESWDVALVPAGPLEGDLGIKPMAHIFVGSKAAWHTITDGLPQHEEYPPEYAAPSVERPKVEARPGVAMGSCLCGESAFEVEGQPMFMQSCHCTRCRRSRGAAHGTNVFYKASQFKWLRGGDLAVDYKVPDARFYTVSFCRKCGGAMPRVSVERDLAIVPAAVLDTDLPMRPQRHIFTNYKAPWFEITDGVQQYPEAPPMPGRP